MPTLYTIGHSTHALRDFIAILHRHHITHVVDVRSIPKSRHVLWFNGDSLKKILKKEKIKYLHIRKLGGLRRPNKHSINQGWHNASFRGFADYMQTGEFYSGLKKLNQLFNRKHKIVIMCAEALPWRCHRSLIADAEIVRGIKVIDIMSQASTHVHVITSFGVVDRSKKPIKIYYPV